MSVSDTLFFAVDQVLDDEKRAAKGLFLNAQIHCDLAALSNLTVQQFFKPYAELLKAKGYVHQAEIDGQYDYALVLLPKNTIEAQGVIARALRHLNKGGQLFCAGDNKAGGARLKKMLQGFGLSDVSTESRNKARCCYGVVDGFDMKAVEAALDKVKIQKVLNGRFLSQPGVFGWDKIDKGSEILTHYIPSDLKGKGADFGCGYGYLSDFVLSHCKKAKALSCLDADQRAVEVCSENLKKYDVAKQFFWFDLTKPCLDLRNLDFVIMNPPFHEGKKQDAGIGKDFIASAYHALKRNGRLWTVANAHLPYEDILAQQFFDCKKHHEGQGFKVFEAIK